MGRWWVGGWVRVKGRARLRRMSGRDPGGARATISATRSSMKRSRSSWRTRSGHGGRTRWVDGGWTVGARWGQGRAAACGGGEGGRACVLAAPSGASAMEHVSKKNGRTRCARGGVGMRRLRGSAARGRWAELSWWKGPRRARAGARAPAAGLSPSSTQRPSLRDRTPGGKSGSEPAPPPPPPRRLCPAQTHR